MSLTGKHIGVAFTGSFCTYEKVFEELKKLAEEGAVVQTIFPNVRQPFRQCGRFFEKSRRNHRAGAYTDHSAGRTDRSEKLSGYFGFIPLYGKYDRQIGERDH